MFIPFVCLSVCLSCLKHQLLNLWGPRSRRATTESNIVRPHVLRSLLNSSNSRDRADSTGSRKYDNAGDEETIYPFVCFCPFTLTLLSHVSLSLHLCCHISPLLSLLLLSFTILSLICHSILFLPDLTILSDAILHGVETRTSAPVQITRKSDTFECSTLKGLYPTGEGAGYAGGIVVSTAR